MSSPDAADHADVGSYKNMMFDGGLVRGSLALWMLVGAAACSVVNKEHCGNLETHATCLERDPGAPYCNICVADNNGCVAEDPGESCLAGTAAPTGADGSETSASPTTGTTVAATDEPSTGVPATSTTSTGDDSTGTSEMTGPATETMTTATATATGEATGSDTTDTGGPVCGNNKVEGDEVCDGTDVNQQKCQTLLPDKWGGGTLTCNNCSSYNDTECCIGVGQECSLVDPDGACCDGLTCKMDDVLMTRCLN